MEKKKRGCRCPLRPKKKKISQKGKRNDPAPTLKSSVASDGYLNASSNRGKEKHLVPPEEKGRGVLGSWQRKEAKPSLFSSARRRQARAAATSEGKKEKNLCRLFQLEARRGKHGNGKKKEISRITFRPNVGKRETLLKVKSVPGKRKK